MENDIVTKFHKVSKIFQDKFHSSTARKSHQEYIESLHEKLSQWKIKTIKQIDNMIKEKLEEIKQCYNAYYQEVDKQYSIINEQIEKKNFSCDLNDQIEYLFIYSQLNSIEKRIHLNTNSFTMNQINENLKINFSHYRELTTVTTILPLKQMFSEKFRTSRDKSLSIYQNQLKKDWVLKPITSQSTEIRSSSSKEPHRKFEISNNLKRQYGVPILIDKSRELSNTQSQLTEYFIDSIDLSHIKPTNNNYEELFNSYKTLKFNENNKKLQAQKPPQSHPNPQQFSLDHFNQSNSSLLLFTNCETKNNCIASSSKRNELIVYNSMINILIIIKHEESKRVYQRFYLHWLSDLSSNLSDITYSYTNDLYFISTNDNNHLYTFNSNEFSISDLGSISENSPLNNIHCYQNTIYCVTGNNAIIELNFDEKNAKINNKRNAGLFVESDLILDITCDMNNLIVIYKNRNNDIYLRSMNRKTLNVELEFLLEKKQNVKRNSVRIESTRFNGIFIYTDNLQKCLKTIDIKQLKTPKVSSIMQLNKSPTNSCLLKDGRLVILHEQPYFLTIHKCQKLN